jgi:hypothetical protein
MDQKIQTFDQVLLMSDQSTIMRAYVSDIKVKQKKTRLTSQGMLIQPEEKKKELSVGLENIIRTRGLPSSRVFEAEAPDVKNVLKGIGGRGDFLKRDRHKLISKSAYLDAYMSAIELYAYSNTPNLLRFLSYS